VRLHWQETPFLVAKTSKCKRIFQVCINASGFRVVTTSTETYV